MADWQPIETAPKDGRHVDLWVRCTFDADNSDRRIDCRWKGGEWICWDDRYDGRGGYVGVDNGTTYVATHWMRVKPPK